MDTRSLLNPVALVGTSLCLLICFLRLRFSRGPHGPYRTLSLLEEDSEADLPFPRPLARGFLLDSSLLNE